MYTEANDKLSRAASAIWHFRNLDPDPMGDPSGDCGDLIAKWEQAHLIRMVLDAGYNTPGEYNDDLNSRMVTGGKMSYHVYELLNALEVPDVCVLCGGALDVWAHRTGNYGGGWDTFYFCPNCNTGEVCV